MAVPDRSSRNGWMRRQYFMRPSIIANVRQIVRFPSRILHIKIINYQGNCTEYTTATEATEAEAATCISPLIRSVGRDEMLKISCSTAENMRHKLCYYFFFGRSFSSLLCFQLQCNQRKLWRSETEQKKTNVHCRVNAMKQNGTAFEITFSIRFL